jgi:hypothetical protein
MNRSAYGTAQLQATSWSSRLPPFFSPDSCFSSPNGFTTRRRIRKQAAAQEYLGFPCSEDCGEAGDAPLAYDDYGLITMLRSPATEWRRRSRPLSIPHSPAGRRLRLPGVRPSQREHVNVISVDSVNQTLTATRLMTIRRSIWPTRRALAGD